MCMRACVRARAPPPDTLVPARDRGPCRVRALDMHNARDERRTWLKLSPVLLGDYVRWYEKQRA